MIEPSSKRAFARPAVVEWMKLAWALVLQALWMIINVCRQIKSSKNLPWREGSLATDAPPPSSARSSRRKVFSESSFRTPRSTQVASALIATLRWTEPTALRSASNSHKAARLSLSVGGKPMMNSHKRFCENNSIIAASRGGTSADIVRSSNSTSRWTVPRLGNHLSFLSGLNTVNSRA